MSVNGRNDLNVACVSSTPRLRKEVLSPTVLVVGGGPSARTVACELTRQSREAIIAIPPGSEPLSSWSNMESKIGFMDDAVVVAFRGHAGDFKATLDTPSGKQEVRCGAAILALDEAIIDDGPHENRTVHLHRLDPVHLFLHGSGPVVMVLTSEEGDRRSHIVAIRKAIAIRDRWPDTDVFLVVREVRAFGMNELDYRRAQSLGIMFVRVEQDPVIRTEDEFSVQMTDLTSGQVLVLHPQLLVLDAPSVPGDNRELARVFGLPVDPQGDFLRPNLAMGPAASMRHGVFLCGAAVSSLLEDEAATEATAAVTKAVSLLSSGHIEYFGDVAEVNEERCSACLTCVRTCPFNAPFMGTEGKAEVDPEVCRGCGICAGICPSRAIAMRTSSDQSIETESKESLEAGK